MIAAWYKERGYHFLAFTDHNVFQGGTRWFQISTNRGGGGVLERYRQRFGPEWVEERTRNGTNEVRLKPLSEFRTRFEEPDRFLLIPAEEISDRHLTAPIHINATNLRDLIPPRGGSNVLDVIQRNIDAVLDQRDSTGQPMLPHVNHPNFGWAITAEELMRVRGERFFEVFNGHPMVRNEGDADHVSVERMWDIMLAWRLAVLDLPLLYGLAVDDAHNYHDWAIKESNPGRGWVMVRAAFLTPESIIRALEAGDFYASTGVRLRDVRRSKSGLRIEIEPEPGVTYQTLFIGTRRDFDRANEPVRNAAGDPLRVTHRYTSDIGEVLATVTGPVAEYTLNGDELYVRARVVSSQRKENPYKEGETETAWVQPVSPATPMPAQQVLNNTSPMVIAHRGYSAFAPENTRAAFKLALEAKVDLVELDYHHTADGVPVVIHDATLDRTTDATAKWGGKDLRLADRTLTELRHLDAGRWFQPGFSHERLATLEEALECIQPRGMTLIERKQGDAATLVRLLHARDMVNHVVVQAFDWDFLRDLHHLEPRQVIGALGPPGSRNGRKLTDDEKALSPRWLEEIHVLPAQVVVWNRQLDAAAVSLAHDMGLRVWVYTINEEPLARTLLAMDVDGLITDNPAVIWKTLSSVPRTR
jgi:glycerophosphoryl diester phosphodiesterase